MIYMGGLIPINAWCLVIVVIIMELDEQRGEGRRFKVIWGEPCFIGEG